jgi:hypothetical protein
VRKVCPTCRSGFSKWIFEHTNIKDQLAVHKSLAVVPFTAQQLPIYTGRKWPGFYAGIDGVIAQWVVPDQYYVTDLNVTWENAQYVLMDLLKERGIDLTSEVQIERSI